MHLRELHLLTPDIAATRRFYGQVMELPCRQLPGQALEVALPGSRLYFYPARAGRPFYHFAFTVPHNQLEAAYAWLGTRCRLLPFAGGQPIADFPNWNARAFYFHDATGNILECIARFDLPNASPQPFSSAGFLALSEAGIATAHVPILGADLTRRFGIPDFVRGPRLPNFAALGDDEGLLILTQEGRGWLPTGRPAEPFWLRVAGLQHGAAIAFEVGERPPGLALSSGNPEPQ